MKRICLVAGLTLLLAACSDSEDATNKESNGNVENTENVENVENTEEQGMMTEEESFNAGLPTEMQTLIELETVNGYIEGGLSEQKDIFTTLTRSDYSNNMHVIERYGKEYFIVVNQFVNDLDSAQREVFVTIVEDGKVVKKDVSTLLEFPDLDAIKAATQTVEAVDSEGNVGVYPVEKVSIKYPYSIGTISSGTNGSSLLIVEEYEITRSYNSAYSQAERVTKLSVYDLNEDGTFTFKKDKVVDSEGVKTDTTYANAKIRSTDKGDHFYVKIKDQSRATILDKELKKVMEYNEPSENTTINPQYIDLKKGLLFGAASVYDVEAEDFIWNDDGSLLEHEDGIFIKGIAGENGFYSLFYDMGHEELKYVTIGENGEVEEIDSLPFEPELKDVPKTDYTFAIQKDTVTIYRPVEFKGKQNVQKIVYNRIDNLK